MWNKFKEWFDSEESDIAVAAFVMSLCLFFGIFIGSLL